jgi:hypothetical protein
LGPKPLLRHRRRPAKGLALHLSCKRWKCVVCRQRLGYARGIHFGRLLIQSQHPIRVILCPGGSAWEALRKQIRRHQPSSYIRVEQKGGASLVFTTATLAGGALVSVEDAIRRLGEAIRAIPRWEIAVKGKGPVTSSRDWKLPARQEGQWKRIGKTRTRQPDRVAAFLRGRGLAPEVVRGDGEGTEWSVYWEVPPMWSEQQVENLYAALEALADPPPPFGKGLSEFDACSPDGMA